MSTEKRKTSTIPKEQFYVNPDVLRKQIEQFYKDDICINDLGNSLNKIAEGLSHSPSFHNYTYRDEMVGDALVKMYSALKFKKFNIEGDTNPFSYFTTIAFHAFINRIKKEKKHHEALEEYKAECYEKLLTAGEIHDENYNIYTRPCDGEEEYFNE
jgi:DNA-directed RNA polymerase specialized sigma24 family protein